jgi:hypothetical protein
MSPFGSIVRVGGEEEEMSDGALNLVIAVLMVLILVLLALRFF